MANAGKDTNGSQYAHACVSLLTTLFELATTLQVRLS